MFFIVVSHPSFVYLCSKFGIQKKSSNVGSAWPMVWIFIYRGRGCSLLPFLLLELQKRKQNCWQQLKYCLLSLFRIHTSLNSSLIIGGAHLNCIRFGDFSLLRALSLSLTLQTEHKTNFSRRKNDHPTRGDDIKLKFS